MSFLGLLNELLLEVAMSLGSDKDVYAFEIANRHLYSLLDDALHRLNTQHSRDSVLLRAASYGCHEVIVRLFHNDVDVNARGGYHGSALQAAPYQGPGAIVRLLRSTNAP